MTRPYTHTYERHEIAFVCLLSAAAGFVLGRYRFTRLLIGEEWLVKKYKHISAKFDEAARVTTSLNEENARLLGQLKRSQQVSDDARGELRGALKELLWRSASYGARCKCNGNTCPECEACKALGWGRYQGADWLEGKLKTEERDRG